jgi:WD40 repeat protein
MASCGRGRYIILSLFPPLKRKAQILASASYDDTIKMYIDDPSDDWFCFLTLTGHSSTVWSLAWSPKNSYLASASDDKTVRIWRRVAEHKWECALVLEGNKRSVYSVSWGVGRSSSPGLGWVAAVGGDGAIRVWELSVGHVPDAVYLIQQHFFQEKEDSTLHHKLIAELPNAHGVYDVNSVVWCPRQGFEDLLATTGDDGATRIWRVRRVN